MRSLPLFSIFFFSFLTLKAQHIQYGPELGINVSGALVKVPGASAKGSPLPGFQAGVFALLPFTSPNLALGARLLYADEGYKPDIYQTRATIRVSFLKVPVNLIYKPAGNHAKWEFGVGPYFAYGISGHYTRNDVNGGQIKINFGNDPNRDDLKKIDMGADLMAGYNLHDKILIRGALDAGLVNYLAPGSVSNAHCLSLGITVCYLLGP